MRKMGAIRSPASPFGEARRWAFAMRRQHEPVGPVAQEVDGWAEEIGRRKLHPRPPCTPRSDRRRGARVEDQPVRLVLGMLVGIIDRRALAAAAARAVPCPSVPADDGWVQR